MKHIYLLLFLCCLPLFGYAVDKPNIYFNDSEKEQRFKALIAELRCVVCQNQSLADSDAELAQDMRDLIREKMQAGESDEQITAFLTERYGDFVLYNPPLKSKTLILWAAPIALIIIAIIVLFLFIRHHAKITTTPPTLSEEEQKRVKEALGE
ncbi:uncharacterized protein involved in biosynthesis of c-type cytochromes [Beggiatoa alba B18LD]|uniref:Cytochrome c-type biogenesis protein n=1 Tax=Beggiatoa alba B18LD TaxID=395493 RepID=I3CI08_9GAMM|nr:cytochrome c-type biogenesis protein [Beggiatoa alba]EIJ43251.1 uncharacterized protein involved in biosynthesis of c-type cytochromes [Beggiatoa alba B18LD]